MLSITSQILNLLSFNLCLEKIELEENHIVQPQGSRFSTTLKLKINIPLAQEIKYGPGLMETLKFAWMQYIMIFIPVIIFTWSGIEFLFKY